MIIDHTQKQLAYQAWVRADEDWQIALQQAFGHNAGDERYTTNGRSGKFAPLYKAVQATRKAYVECPFEFESV